MDIHIAQYLEAYSDKLAPVITYAALALPIIGKVIVSLLAGWFFAKLMRKGTLLLLDRIKLEELTERAGASTLLEKSGQRGKLHATLSRLVHGLCLAITLYFTAEVTGLRGVSAMLGKIVGFMPKLCAATCIVLVGAFIANFVGNMITRMLGARPEFESPELVGRAIGALIITLTSAMAAGQLGFEVALINGLISLLVSGVILAAALTLGLGIRPICTQMMLKHYAMRTFEDGEDVELCGHRGTLSSFGSTVLVLHTEHGRVFLPYDQVMNAPVRRFRKTIAPLSSKQSSTKQVP